MTKIEGLEFETDKQRNCVPVSEIHDVLSEKQLEEFGDFMHGQTVTQTEDGEMCYFIRDVKRFLQGKDVID